MKIRCPYPYTPVHIHEAVENRLRADNDEGMVESASTEARNAGDMLARLVAMLHSNGALTDTNVLDLLGSGYERVKDEL